MRIVRFPFALFVLVTVIPSQTYLSAQDLDRAAVVRAIDSIVNGPIAAGQIAGASVAVVHGADTVLLQAYGYADLEFHVPTPDRAIYEIGSVTKQFTAVAILQLVAGGFIDLDAVFTEYLPDYPADDHGITVRQLMDHTSGIKGYTEMERFETIATRALARDSLVAMFGAAPLDFQPGTAMIYNNSAYFLLGLIIEAVTGEKYEDYVRDNLFGAAGMPDSRYCSSSAIIERRAHGYDSGPAGLLRKDYIDHTWPYSAGSLCSTAWDLVAWNEALHGDGSGGMLLDAGGYRELTTPGSLSDGTPLRYAKGLAVFESEGHRAISHGGGIPGFLSQVTYYPEYDLSIIVLVNTAGPPGAGSLADEIASLLLEEKTESPAGKFEGDLNVLAGSYRGPGRGRELAATVSSDSGELMVAFGESDAETFEYVEGATFRRGNSRITFILEAGAVDRIHLDQVGGLYVLFPDRG